MVKKTDCNTKITEIENKVPSINGLVTSAAFITKATKIESKRPKINLSTKAALN